MMICLMVIAFFATALSGPAGIEWLAERRARRELRRLYAARVVYLPSASCKGECPLHRGEYPCLCLGAGVRLLDEDGVEFHVR